MNAAVKERMLPIEVSRQYAVGRRAFGGIDFNMVDFRGFKLEGIDVRGSSFVNANVTALAVNTMAGLSEAVFRQTQVTLPQALHIAREMRKNGIDIDRSKLRTMFTIVKRE